MAIRRKIFFTLLVASAIGTLAVLPYALTPSLLEKIKVPLWIFISVQLVQALILSAICIFIGLILAKKVGLGAPLLEDYFEGKGINVPHALSLLKTAIACGVLVGIAIFAIDFLCFNQILTSVNEQLKPTLLQRFMASFYGGICEEIFIRLFLMTVLVWGFFKIKKSNLSVWLAIIISTILFGLGHLPMTVSVIPLSALVVLRALILNGIAGIVFGWLYWKKGLESAMIAHFTTDIVLHVILMSFVLK
jgi:membrane protease YdiL (CAAX protease family)